MLVEEILKNSNNSSVEGTFLIYDQKLKAFTEKQGHFLTFTLQDKTGTVWSRIWDNAENIFESLKDIQVVTIIGKINFYNGKTQVIVEKIKKADEGTYKMGDLIKVANRPPEEMWSELNNILEDNLTGDYKKIWYAFKENVDFEKRFKSWPGGKGSVHHAYQNGLLEHSLSAVKFVNMFHSSLTLPFDLEKALLGSAIHDIGKLEAYEYDGVTTTMSNIGRLHEHTVLGYFMFRKTVENLGVSNVSIIEDVGHIILSHHGTREQHAIINPMSIEAKVVAAADYFDADTNYMIQQLESNSDEQGWLFDTLKNQFFFKRPIKKQSQNTVTFKRRKIS